MTINSAIILPPKSQKLAKLEKKLEGEVGKAIADYQMIEEGDTVLVCLSGGKDSYTLLHILLNLQKRAPIKFDLIAMNLDQKQPGFPGEILPNYLEKIGVNFRIVEADTYSIVKEKIPTGKTTCSLCSRLRRGIIYRTAKELGANKIALGHHQDDMVHTLFLNLFFAGKLKAMPPKYLTDDSAHIVIRPLAYCSENDIIRYARGMEFPIIPCNLCGSQDNLQRQKIREMINQWESNFPGRIQAVFTAMQNVVPGHLADRNLFDFAQLKVLSTLELEVNAASINKNDLVYPFAASLPDKSTNQQVQLSFNQPSLAAVLFADIVHSSYLYVELGDAQAMKVISQCQEIMLSAVATFHALRTKTLGDGVLAIFANAEESLRAGIAIQRLLNALICKINVEIELRIGIHFGQIIADERDVYGDALNVSARLMENAKPCSILCSWQVVSLAEQSTRELLKDQGVILVKGRAEQINVFELNWQSGSKDGGKVIPIASAPLPEKRLILVQQLLHRYVDLYHPVLLIGSSLECNFIIDNPAIAAHHARIEYRHGEIYYIDQSYFGSIILRPGQSSVILRHDEINLSADGKILLCCNDNLINLLQKKDIEEITKDNYLPEDGSLLSFHIIDTEKI